RACHNPLPNPTSKSYQREAKPPLVAADDQSAAIRRLRFLNRGCSAVVHYCWSSRAALLAAPNREPIRELRIHRSLISEATPVQYRIGRIAVTHRVRYGVSNRQVKPAADGVLPYEMSSAAGDKLGERSVACLPVELAANRGTGFGISQTVGIFFTPF